MFDVGFSELVLIALLALVVLGPKRLPEAARAAGHWLGKLRRFVSDVKQDFDRELNTAELAELRKLKQELDNTRRVIEESSGKLYQDLVTHAPPDNTIKPETKPETPALETDANPAPPALLADAKPRTPRAPRTKKKHVRDPKPGSE